MAKAGLKFILFPSPKEDGNKGDGSKGDSNKGDGKKGDGKKGENDPLNPFNLFTPYSKLKQEIVEFLPFHHVNCKKIIYKIAHGHFIQIIRTPTNSAFCRN